MALTLLGTYVFVAAAFIFCESFPKPERICEASESKRTVICIAKPREPVCLVCPRNISAGYVWKRDNETFYSGYSGGHQLNPGDYTYDVCHPHLASLKVAGTEIVRQHETFSCSKEITSNNTFTFLIEVEDDTRPIYKPSMNCMATTNTLNSTCKEVTLKCVIRKSPKMVKSTWEVNGTVKYEGRFQPDLYENGTFASIFRFCNTELWSLVICKSSSGYFEDRNATCSIEKQSSGKIMTYIIAGIVISLASAVGTLYIFTRHCYKLPVTSANLKGEFNQMCEGEGTALSLQSHSYEILEASQDYYMLYDSVNDHQNVPECTEMKFTQGDNFQAKRGQNRGMHENGNCAVLNEQVKATRNFEYWKGTWISGSLQEKACFLKTLSEHTTLKKAENFKLLVERLSRLPAHENVVTILSVYTREVPYAICYNYVEFGTLRDFLMQRYQKDMSTKTEVKNAAPYPSDSKGQTAELMFFSHDIVKAMLFIISQRFSHPALCTRKILLTENVRCKLYDIFPIEMAILKVEEMTNKKHPPSAWLAPETIFLKEYSSASDVWNFAVVLWEIFSVGDIPHNVMAQSQMERTITSLPHPLGCPGEIYSVMLSCWATSPSKRLTFEQVATRFANLMKTNSAK
ncbi:Fibroblast growth factor receptor 4 [Holothuria leucospilota]|uniref:Fibroblast growth factor receptor 4 n=1 Tax=Holothuria leucospilota TaxID=206669 RepID=A0A9Q1C736_HOLLE|nr:Fibroblast growth factor receptor 4 [Holothuria leucospilota]